MKSKMFLQSVHKKDSRFEILQFDQVTKIAKLKGRYTTIYQPLTTDVMQKYGYRIEQVEVSDE